MQGQNIQDEGKNTSQAQNMIAVDKYILLGIFSPVSH